MPRFRLREEFRRRGGLYHLYVILSLCLSVLCVILRENQSPTREMSKILSKIELSVEEKKSELCYRKLLAE